MGVHRVSAAGTRRPASLAVALVVALVATLVPTLPAMAADPADLDPTFGGGSEATLFGPGDDELVASDDVLIRPDGRIVVVGTSKPPAGTTSLETPGIFVAQLTATGQLDESFNGGGSFTYRFGGDPAPVVSVNAAALQDDGKILVVGTIADSASGTNEDVLVARFTAAGLPDSSFGPAGHRRFNLSPAGENFSDRAMSVALTTATFIDPEFGESTGARILVAATQTTSMGLDGGGAVARDEGVAVLRLHLDGTLDTAWRPTGVTYANPTSGNDWVTDLAVLPDGRFSVVGFAGDTDTMVLRFGADGTPDTTWGGDGTVITDAAPGASDGARSVAVEADGRTVVSGYWAGSGVRGMLLRYQADGSPDVAFGTSGRLIMDFDGVGSQSNAGSVTLDPDGRAVVVGQNLGPPPEGSEGTMLGVARFHGTGYDATFGGDGRRSYDCFSGGGSAIAWQGDGQIVAAGTCGTRIRVIRLLGDTAAAEPTGPAVADVTVSLAGESADAGYEVIRPEDVDPAALLTASNANESLQSAPVRNTPVRNTPVRNTPVRNTPVRNTPVRNTALADPALPPVLLSEVRLFEGDWATRMAGTRFAGAPLHTVTLQDLLAITEPDPLADLTLDQIAIEDTPVRNTSYAALVLSGVALEHLPAPTGGWCDFLTAQPFNCGNGVATGTTTLLALELNGVDLTAYLGQPVSLHGTDITGSTLATVLLVDVNLPATPFAAAASSSVSELLTCGDSCPATLGEAHDEGVVSPTATLGQLVARLPLVGGPADVSLGELLRGLFHPDDLPFADLPLSAILEAAEVRTERLTQVTVEFDLDCAQASGFEVELETAPGVRYAGGDFLAADVFMSHVTPEWQSLGGGAFRLSDPTICQDIPSGGVRHLTARLDVEPFAALDVLPAAATVTAGEDSQTASVASPLPVVDGAESGDARPVEPGVLYTGYIGSPGDVDDFTFPAPAAGSVVTVTVSHLPADYDIVLYGPEEGVVTAPVRNTPVRNTPVRNTSLGDAATEPGSDAGLLPPEGLQDVPVRNTPVRNTSLHRGTATESATTLIHDGDEGAPFTVQVSGYDGAWSPSPYVLQVRVTPGPEPLPCADRTYTGSGTAGTYHQPAGLADDQVETLILVNRRRLGEVHGGDPADLMDDLEAFAARSDVNGVVIPVEADPAVASAYAAWDADACSVEAANDVVTAINTHVDDVRAGMTNLRHVVVIGSDEVIPFGRVPDRTTVGNQASYSRDVAFGGEDNAISRAFGRRFVLSDDPYADLDPVGLLQGGKLYVPDLGIGRLVETPSQIRAALAQFVDNAGVLDPDTAFTAGYEFLTDGAEAVDGALSSRVGAANASSEINETWDSIDALAGLQGTDRFASVNAHYDHHQGLPAQAFNTGGPDLFTTAGVENASFAGSILFTMGCHSGLNVPDVYVAAPTADEVASLADWPQATTSRGAAYTGNTGYGYGDTEVVGYSERLMALHAENLASGTMTVGQSLMFAKQQHFGELGIPGVYDAKAMHESTFYGLPMYRIGSSGTVAPPVLPNPAVDTGATESEPFEVSPVTSRIDGDRGSYWVVEEDGEPLPPQVSHFRPIQPRTSLDVTGSLPVHGVLIEELASGDVPGRVDPVYSEPTIDLGVHQAERTPVEMIYPAGLARLARYATPQGTRDDLVLVPGQFISDPDARDGQGTQRLFSRIAGTVLRSDAGDWEPPTIATFAAFTSGSAAQFVATTASEDVARGVVLYRDDVSDDWRRVELEEVEPGRWVGGDLLAASAMHVREAFLQLADDAGNVGTQTNKGEYEESTPLAEPHGVALVLSPELPPTGYFATIPAIGVTGADGATFTYRLDGGAWTDVAGDRIDLPEDLTDGVHIVDVQGSDGSEGTLLIPLDRQPPDITFVTPAAGAVYEIGAEVVADFRCADALSGVASCTGTVAPGEDVDTSEGTHTFTVTATDHAGHERTASVSYTADARFEGFLAPIAGDGVSTIYNAVQAGRTVPIKFRLWHGAEQKVDTEGVTVTASPPFVCDGTGSSSTVTETTTDNGAGELRYDTESGQFIYNYATNKSWGGGQYCTTVTVRYGDVLVKTAHFRFTK